MTEAVRVRGQLAERENRTPTGLLRGDTNPLPIFAERSRLSNQTTVVPNGGAVLIREGPRRRSAGCEAAPDTDWLGLLSTVPTTFRSLPR